MQGLLGTSFDDPRTMAVLQAAQGLLGPGRTMQRFTTAAQGYGQTMAAAKREEEERKRRALQEQMLMQQLESAKAQQAQQQAAMQRQQGIEAAYRGALESPAQQALAGGGGPTAANAEKIPSMTGGVNQQKLIQGLMQFDPMAAFQMMQPKEVEIKEYREIRMPDGSVQVVGFGKDGKPVQTGQTPFKTPEVRDFGDFLGGIDPITGKVSKLGRKGQTPDSVASNALTRRGQDMQDARSRESNAGGRVPPGYRFKPDGTLEAIPGGPADIKAGEIGAKTEARKATAAAQASSVLGIISEAKELVGMNTAGVGSLAAKIPATDARNLAAKLETVKANLGFDRLQQMREESPTGGALGAIAVQELVALQATVSSLDQAQSPAQLRQSLEKVEKHYSRWLQTLKGETPGGGATGGWEDLGGGFRIKGK